MHTLTRPLVWLPALLLIAAYAVPYLLLHNVPSFAGSFLFWCLFGLVAIALILLELARWRP